MASPQSAHLRSMLVNDIAPQFTKDVPLERQRQALEAIAAAVELPPDVNVEPTEAAGLPAEWLSGPDNAVNGVMLYLHGGAYVMGSCNTHRDLAAYLVLTTGLRGLVIEYRLAPEHPYPTAVEDAVAAYRWLLENGNKPEQIVLAGDSAGGGLTVATLLSLRDAGDPMPAAAILLSPWADLAGEGESLKTRAEVEPWLDPKEVVSTGKQYVGEADPKSPLVSPVYADLHSLPPFLIHVGGHEILLSDSTRLAEKARAAGVEVELKVWDEMWHVFQMFAAALPEGQQSIDEIGAFVRQKLGQKSA